MQVSTGTETEICRQWRSRIMEEDEDVFVFLAERMTKVHGEWSLVTARMFPGYVFVDTDRIQDFYDRMNHMKSRARILRMGEEMTPIYEAEEKHLKALGGTEHIVRYSQGYICGEELMVTSGAMRHCRGKVKKVLRHKRLVVLEVLLMGRPVEVTLGLGIVSRTEKTEGIKR